MLSNVSPAYGSGAANRRTADLPSWHFGKRLWGHPWGPMVSYLKKFVYLSEPRVSWSADVCDLAAPAAGLCFRFASNPSLLAPGKQALSFPQYFQCLNANLRQRTLFTTTWASYHYAHTTSQNSITNTPPLILSRPLRSSAASSTTLCTPSSSWTTSPSPSSPPARSPFQLLSGPRSGWSSWSLCSTSGVSTS
jgi:hypothetical protein